MHYNESYKHKALRRKLVEELREKGISDEKLLEAINTVPRHLFFETIFHDRFAYSDQAFPIAAGQTISQPYTVAKQTSLLKLETGMKILEIGTGSGYQTSVLAQFKVKIFSIERQRELFHQTKSLLESMNVKAKLFFGDGFEGKESFAPFDRIIITCGAPYVPPALLKQLKPTGRMVIPLGEGDQQEMILIEKDSNGDLYETNYGPCSFVPMLKKKQF